MSGRVLVVEANPTNRKVIEAILINHGLSVTSVENGLQGINAIAQGNAPDLVLMDVQMPVLDGYDATRRIRRWETDNARAPIPIIALTADAYEEDRQRCLAAGMDGFLTKPVDIDELLLTISRWLKSDDNQTNQAGIAGKLSDVAVPHGDAAVFDEEHMLSQLGGDRILAKAIVQTATEDIQNYLDQL